MNLYIYLLVFFAAIYFNYFLYIDYKEGRKESSSITFLILGLPIIVFTIIISQTVESPEGVKNIKNKMQNINFCDIMHFPDKQKK